MEVYVYDAVRTPRGKSKASGGLAEFTPQELVGQLIGALKTRSGEDAIERAAGLTLGCVGQIGAQGGHIALVSRLHAGLPDTVRAVHGLDVNLRTTTDASAHARREVTDTGAFHADCSGPICGFRDFETCGFQSESNRITLQTNRCQCFMSVHGRTRSSVRTRALRAHSLTKTTRQIHTKST